MHVYSTPAEMSVNFIKQGRVDNFWVIKNPGIAPGLCGPACFYVFQAPLGAPIKRRVRCRPCTAYGTCGSDGAHRRTVAAFAQDAPLAVAFASDHNGRGLLEVCAIVPAPPASGPLASRAK